mgnify:CR=1 FL=1
MLKETIKKLEEELKGLTLYELSTNKKNIQQDLINIKNLINDFFMMINNKNRIMNIKLDGAGEFPNER